MAVPPQDRDPLSVLFPSHPLEWKGSADVVAALNELRTEGVPLKVSAFGQKAPAALGLAEPFSFHANPPQPGLRALYNPAALFVSASHADGWGMPPAEADACGAALVVSSPGGPSDYLTDRETAPIFSPRDLPAPQ